MFRRKRSNVPVLLLLLVLFVTIGYAALGTTLNINGTSTINNASWDIHFTNLNVTTGSVTGTQVTKAATLDTTTSVGYNITLNKPGEFYEFTVDVVNTGTIDGMINAITSKLNDAVITTLPKYLNYTVTYSDGTPIELKQKLDSGSTETYKVRIEFRTDIENTDLPSTAQVLNLSFQVDYVQKDNTATVIIHKFTGIKYGVYPETNKLTLNSTVPANAILHLNADDALADWTNPDVMNKSSEPFYLKHVIENDIVKGSYIVFIVTPEMAQANSGMVAGTYELKGEKTYEGVTNLMGEDYISLYYEANKETLKNVFGYSTNPSRCTEYETGSDSYFVCYISGFLVETDANGSVDVTDGALRCSVDREGNAYCSDF